MMGNPFYQIPASRKDYLIEAATDLLKMIMEDDKVSLREFYAQISDLKPEELRRVSASAEVMAKLVDHMLRQKREANA